MLILLNMYQLRLKSYTNDAYYAVINRLFKSLSKEDF